MKILDVFRRKRKEDKKVTVANLAPVNLSSADEDLMDLLMLNNILVSEFEPQRAPDGWHTDGTYCYPDHETTHPPVADSPSPGYGGGQSDYGSSTSQDYSPSSCEPSTSSD